MLRTEASTGRQQLLQQQRQAAELIPNPTLTRALARALALAL